MTATAGRAGRLAVALSLALGVVGVTASPAWAPRDCPSCGLFIPAALQEEMYAVYPEVEVIAVAHTLDGTDGVLVDTHQLHGKLRHDVIDDCVGCTLTRNPNQSRTIQAR